MNPLATTKVAAALRAAARVWRAGLRPARWSFAAAVGVAAALSVPLVAAGTPSAAHASHLPVSHAAAEPVASQPIAAQPTVTEGATNARGDRLLAGADRYATAVLLASVPLDAGDAATREVLVVSGESLVDAVSAVSVAASRDAAIVLTETERVPEVVAEFIAERGFDRVTVGGGTAAVSDTTADELAALIGDANASTTGGGSDGAAGDASGVVPRVAGATRFETAVAAARAAGEPGVWCDGRTAAVLVSGNSLVDGVIAAPVAYAMGLPLLFTEPDALPDAVVDYLADANVERVVVVGGPDDVADTGVERAVVVGSTGDISGAVLAQLGRLGVATVTFDAATPAARSVELVEAIDGCATQPVAPGEFALLDAHQPVDGVAAAAALATGLGEHSASETLIPVLAVNQDSLPQPVADYLAQVGRRHDQITLYPLGGVARLTPRVIDSAVVAAGGEPPERAASDDDADDDAGDDPGGGATAGAGRRPAGVGNPDARNPGDVGAPSGGVPGASSSSTVVGGVRGAAGGAAGVPEFAATEDLDGDGELSFDELYPADTSHRDAFLAVSDGVAPPGAFAPPVPDLAEVRADPRRSELSLGRTSHDRFPNGFPLPPGAPDYATTTFDERQQLRADAYAAYAKPDQSLNTARGQWDDMYAISCKRRMENRERNHGRTQGGFETYPCEWLADWSIWQCDVLNDPAVTRLAPHEQWIELTVRYYDLWVDLVGRDRFHAATKEVFAIPQGWRLWGEQYSLNGFWEGTTYVGSNYCSFRLDSQPSQANETFHNQQVTLLHDYFNTRTGSDYAGDADDYIFQHVWLSRNRWYLDDVCSVDSSHCPSQTRGG